MEQKRLVQIRFAALAAVTARHASITVASDRHVVRQNCENTERKKKSFLHAEEKKNPKQHTDHSHVGVGVAHRRVRAHKRSSVDHRVVGEWRQERSRTVNLVNRRLGSDVCSVRLDLTTLKA